MTQTSKEQVELVQTQRVALLEAFYDLSKQSVHQPISLQEAAKKIGVEDINQALSLAGYLKAKGLFNLSGGGWGGRMTASGIDMVEKWRTPSPQNVNTPTTPSVFHYEDKSIRVSSSRDAIVQTGQNNVQTVNHDFGMHIEQIAKAINEAHASLDSKNEAKTLLANFLKHPLVTSIAGSIAGSLIPK